MAPGFLPLPSAFTDDTSVRRNAPMTNSQVADVKLEHAGQFYSSYGFYDNEEEKRPVKMEDLCPTNDFRVNQDVRDQEQDKDGEEDFIVKQDDPDQEQTKEDEEEEVSGRREEKRPCRSQPSPTSRLRQSSFRAEHHYQLHALLRKFMREHRWKEAAGVLSSLVRGTPSSNSISEGDLRKNYTIAMELHWRSFNSDDRKYETWIRQIYDTWMSKLSRSRDDSGRKTWIRQIYDTWMSKLSRSRDDSGRKNVILMELANSYLLFHRRKPL